MREPKTDIPGLVLNQKGASRIAYFPAEVDSRYGLDSLPDHATLLANTVHWAIGERSVLDVKGPGLLDCHLYSQRDCMVLHVVNLSNEAAWRAPMEELIPIGPLHVNVRLSSGVKGASARSLVSTRKVGTKVAHGWASFEIPSVRDHDVIVIS